MDKLELVSPAGSFDQLKAAANAGADAVYLAYEKYGARAYAENFNFKGLENAINFAHSRNIKAYLALNTLIKEKELNEFLDFIFQLFKKINFNGVIVQDLAVKKILGEIFPEVPVHASTQLNIHNSLSMEFLKNSGFKRVVLAREMTLDEIKEISLKNILDIEIFGHGSQCYSYSGQCYFSSFVGDRSGNRGRCPQPCRMKYDLIYEKDGQLNDQPEKSFHNSKTIGDYYFLSKSDLNTIFELPQIIKAGINALKLEGRMKTPEYVAIITKVYRKYIDLYYNNPQEFKVDEKDIYKLKQIFAREINEGYLKDKFPENIMSLKKSGSVGSSFGRILKIEPEKSSGKNLINIYIRSNINLNKGDILEIWTKKGNSRLEVDVFELADDKNDKKNLYKIQTNSNPALNLNDRVFKYFDYELDREAKSLYLSREYNIPENINIKTNFKIENYFKLKSLLKKPDKQKDYSNTGYNNKQEKPTQDHNISLSKSSISLFFYDEIINSETILKNLTSIILANQKKYGKDFININLCYEDCINLFENNNEKEIKKIIDIYKNLKKCDSNFYLVTPNIAYDKQISILEKILLKLLNSGLNNFYVSNPGVLQLLNKSASLVDFPLNIILGYNLNLFNSFAINSITEHLDSKIITKEIILSAELTLQETNEIIVDLSKNEGFKSMFFKTRFSIFGYGFYPIMTSRVNYNKIIGSVDKDLKNFSLIDRKNYRFKLSQDYLLNTQIFNSKKHCLLFDIKEIVQKRINGFLIDLKFLDEEEIYHVFKSFIEGIIIAEKINKLKTDEFKSRQSLEQKYEAFILRLSKSPYISDYTKGHLFREII
ncbi:MAG: U32 family peptidase [Candidatus Humimicrobiaceae bacterium]